MKKLLILLIVLGVILFFGTEWYFKKNLKTIVSSMTVDAIAAEVIFDVKISVNNLSVEELNLLCFVLREAYEIHTDIETLFIFDNEKIIDQEYVLENKKRVGKKIKTHCEK